MQSELARSSPMTGLSFAVLVPALAIKGAVCFACHQTAPNLSRCSKCQQVWYCSTSCQKKDWNDSDLKPFGGNHQKLCRKLVAANKLNPLNSQNRPYEPRTWGEYRLETLWRKSMWKSTFDISDYDVRVFSAQPYCSSCYRNISQLPAGSKLALCSTCRLAHYCNSCTQSEHSSQCPRLVDIRRAEEFEIKHYRGTGEHVPRAPTESPRKTYVPISTANSWYDYFTLISDKSMVTGSASLDLKPLADDNAEMAAALTAATDELSMFLTTIAGLEATGLATKPFLNLHIIGATSMELRSSAMFEEIMHLLPTLQHLRMCFVGPDVPQYADVGTKRVMLDICPPCADTKRTRSLELYTGAYHNYVSTANYEIPDLAVAFQTGHSCEEVESWAPTIRHLAQKAQHPTVFTAFNEFEMVDELKSLEKLRARFIVEGQLNKWKGMRPMLDPLEEVENSIYYQHQYWYVISGQSSRSTSSVVGTD